MQETVDLHIHVYKEIVYIGHYKASEDRKTLAFFQRLESLDAIVQKHVDLATKVAATYTTREKPIHRILPVAHFKIRRCC